MPDAPLTNDDNFAAAFAQHAGGDDAAATAAPAAPAEPVAPAAAPAAPAADAAAAGSAATGAGDAANHAAEPAAGAADAGAGDGTAAAGGEGALSDEDLLARFAAMMRQPGQEPPAESAAQPSASQPAPEIFSPEEQQFLTQYEKDWPDVARAETLRRRAEYRDLVNYVFNEVAQHVGPLLQTVQTLAERTHLSDLHTVVTDYDDVREKVIHWAQEQPAYLQPAYFHVIQQGTVEEVADLIDRYKRDTGVTIAAPAAPAAQPAARSKPAAELPSTTMQAAASLAPVSAKRSGAPQVVDPMDFESAFESFASKL